MPTMPGPVTGAGSALKTDMDQRVDTGKSAELANLGSPNRMRAYVVLAMTIGALLVCVLLALPFLAALTWALALAILCMPSHRWIESKIKSPSLAALISVCWIGLVVVMPAIWISARLMTEAAAGAVCDQGEGSVRGMAGHFRKSRRT